MAEDAASHIALLIHSLDPGGAQRRVVTLANSFTELGRKVDLVTMDTRGPLREALSPDIRLIRLGTGKMSRGLKRIIPRRLHVWLSMKRLAAYLRIEQPDIMVSGANRVHSIAIVARLLSRRQVPLVLRVSNHPFCPVPWTMPMRRSIEIGRRWMKAQLYPRADGIIAVSEDVARGIVRLSVSDRSIKTIPNPTITPEFLAGMAGEVAFPWADEQIPLILGVGRFALQKDFATLIRAFALVRAECPARLVLLGDGLRRKQLERLVRYYKLDGDTFMPGQVNMVAAWMKRADVLVSSSLWEGLPATLIEALAVGCPIVATDCPGGSREILDDGRLGALVPLRDPRAMARAILTTLAGPRNQDALQYAAQRFAVSGKAEQYLAVIDRWTQARR